MPTSSPRPASHHAACPHSAGNPAGTGRASCAALVAAPPQHPPDSAAQSAVAPPPAGGCRRTRPWAASSSLTLALRAVMWVTTSCRGGRWANSRRGALRLTREQCKPGAPQGACALGAAWLRRCCRAPAERAAPPAGAHLDAHACQLVVQSDKGASSCGIQALHTPAGKGAAAQVARRALMCAAGHPPAQLGGCQSGGPAPLSRSGRQWHSLPGACLQCRTACAAPCPEVSARCRGEAQQGSRALPEVEDEEARRLCQRSSHLGRLVPARAYGSAQHAGSEPGASDSGMPDSAYHSDGPKPPCKRRWRGEPLTSLALQERPHAVVRLGQCGRAGQACQSRPLRPLGAAPLLLRLRLRLCHGCSGRAGLQVRLRVQSRGGNAHHLGEHID